jgi:NAD+ kinase
MRAQMKGVHITLRMRLECRIVRRGAHAHAHAGADEVHEVLNEVVVDRGANPYLAKIECWERDTLITKARPPTPLLAALSASRFSGVQAV